MNTTIQIKPSGIVFTNRAMVRIMLKDMDGACEDLKRAIQMNFEPAQRLKEIYCTGNNTNKSI